MAIHPDWVQHFSEEWFYCDHCGLVFGKRIPKLSSIAFCPRCDNICHLEVFVYAAWQP